MASKRGPYELKVRAERRDRTRERLVEAAADLHGEVGPAFTTMADVAERAGVSRMTAYRHFPSERELFRACGAHFVAGNAPPASEPWLEIQDPFARLRRGLSDIYAYYGRHDRRIANVLRDSRTMPVGGVFRDAEKRWASALLEGWPAHVRRRRRLRAALGLAVRFETWHYLSETGASDGDVIRLIEAAARDAAAA